MEVTKIAKVGKDDRFAVFIDGTLRIFLSGQSVLGHNLSVGRVITEEEIAELKSQSNSDQLYLRTLRYLNLRIRSEGELRQYLKRLHAPPEQIKDIICRLKKLDLINDERFTAAFIHDKLLATPSSRKKIAYELKKKQIAKEIIEASLNNDQLSDMASLNKLIAIKRRQSKYQDDLKLMQYLVRNGFNYGDVKQALKYEA